MSKKLLLLLTVCTLFFAGAKAQYVTLTDTAFQAFLKSKYPTCFNATGQLDTTCSSILTEDSLALNDITMPQHASVTNLHGLQYFKGLKDLRIYHLSIRTLAKLPDLIENLIVDHNDSLSTLTNFPANMIYLYAEYNSLVSLPPFHGASNQGFWGPCIVSHNKLTSLPALPNPTVLNLGVLDCSYNNLTSLPFDSGTIVQYLYAHHNQLTSISYVPGVDIADISYNQLTSLPLNSGGGGSFFYCNNNNITSLDLSNYSYGEIYCQNNQLSVISKFGTFYNYPTKLDCSNNPLTSLPTLPYWIHELYIQNTQISSLSLPLSGNPSELNHLETYNNNMSCLPAIAFNYLKIDTLQFPCVPVASTVYSSSSGLSVSNYPVCNPTNAQFGCNPAPVIKGKIFYDLNSNGVKDAGEFYAQYNRLNLSDGSYTYTDHTGFYKLSVSQLYSPLTLTPVAPSLYKAVPADSTFNFWQSDTMVTWDIPLQPLGAKDSVSAFVTNYSFYSGPGGWIHYTVNWQNEGTTTLGPTDIVLKADQARLNYFSCSNAAIVQNGNQLTLQLPSLAAGASGSYLASFTINATAQFGDTAFANVAITSGSLSSVDTTNTPIRYAFDPNDKQATQTLSPQQISSGGYIDYIIRFQNTGNDTAINVVIADTLSAKLKANTVELVATSHNCNVIAKGNRVYFEMKNIMLPDSNVNEPASHGYIRFKIKPVSTLALGDSVNNKASIYFDYNTPVVTNTAVTNIKVQAFPLKLLSFKGNRLSQGNVYLYWQTANEENTKSFDVEQSLNGRSFEKIGEVKAFGNGNHNYTYTTDKVVTGNVYFRLKMIDKDGKFTYAPIVLIKAGDVKGSFVLGANPVNEKLVINAINPSLINTEATLINSSGVVVKRFVLNGASQTVGVGNLPAGPYYLRTQQGSEKVMIVR